MWPGDLLQAIVLAADGSADVDYRYEKAPAELVDLVPGHGGIDAGDDEVDISKQHVAPQVREALRDYDNGDLGVGVPHAGCGHHGLGGAQVTGPRGALTREVDVLDDVRLADEDAADSHVGDLVGDHRARTTSADQGDGGGPHPGLAQFGDRGDLARHCRGRLRDLCGREPQTGSSSNKYVP